MIEILGIVGSPRKGGNTEFLMRETLKACEEEGAETKLIHLTDFDLKPCDGCRSCFKTGNCVIEDDAEKIFKEIVGAEGILIGSPVYFYNTTAQTKTFIDKVGYLHSARGRKHFRKKVGGAITVAGGTGLISAASQILMFYHSTRMITAAPIVTGVASAKGEAEKDTRGIQYARELGKTLVEVAKATKQLRKVRD
jgi:multimeric flavodoxin WrbA